MTDRYPHAPECPKMRPTISHWDCTCGATAQQSAFDAGKREADARAMAVVEAAKAYVRHVLMFRTAEEGWDCPEEKELHDSLVSQGFITKDGERRG